MFSYEIKKLYTKESIEKKWMQIVEEREYATGQRIQLLADAGFSLIRLAGDLYGLDFVDYLQSLM